MVLFSQGFFSSLRRFADLLRSCVIGVDSSHLAFGFFLELSEKPVLLGFSA
jgi:hypothetical protein